MGTEQPAALTFHNRILLVTDTSYICSWCLRMVLLLLFKPDSEWKQLPIQVGKCGICGQVFP